MRCLPAKWVLGVSIHWKISTGISSPYRDGMIRIMAKNPGLKGAVPMAVNREKDRNGNIIPGAFLMSMDYSGINYDYNDNTFLITNIKPLSPPAAPTGLTATPSGAGIVLVRGGGHRAGRASDSPSKSIETIIARVRRVDRGSLSRISTYRFGYSAGS